MYCNFYCSNIDFFSMPNDMKCEIVYELSASDISSLQLVCKDFFVFLKEPQVSEKLWKKRAIDLMGKEQAEEFFLISGDWKCTYFRFKRMQKIGTVISPSEIKTPRRKYTVKFENEKLKGTATDYDGSMMEGEFDEFGNLHGQGERVYRKGTRLKGNFEKGELNGNGTISFPDGTAEVGKFERGRLEVRKEEKTLDMKALFEKLNFLADNTQN